MVELLDPTTLGVGFDTLNFQIALEGSTVIDEMFTDLGDAAAYFDNQTLELAFPVILSSVTRQPFHYSSVTQQTFHYPPPFGSLAPACWDWSEYPDARNLLNKAYTRLLREPFLFGLYVRKCEY